MYMLPLRFVTVGPNVAICATRIVSLVSYESNQARVVLKRERKAGNVLNASGRGGIRTVIFLDNGTLIASPRSVEWLINKIQEAETKTIIGGQHRHKNNFITTRVPIDPEEPDEDDELLDLDITNEEEDDDHEDCEPDGDPFESDDE